MEYAAHIERIGQSKIRVIAFADPPCLKFSHHNRRVGLSQQSAARVDDRIEHLSEFRRFSNYLPIEIVRIDDPRIVLVDGRLPDAGRIYHVKLFVAPGIKRRRQIIARAKSAMVGKARIHRSK